MRAHRLESDQKTVKVGVSIKRLHFRDSSPFAVPLAQFEQGGRLNRALQMQMQLRLGQLTDESVGRAFQSRRHLLIVDSRPRICEATPIFVSPTLSVTIRSSQLSLKESA